MLHEATCSGPVRPLVFDTETSGLSLDDSVLELHMLDAVSGEVVRVVLSEAHPVTHPGTNIKKDGCGQGYIFVFLETVNQMNSNYQFTMLTLIDIPAL